MRSPTRKPLPLPSERDVKRLVAELRHDASELQLVIDKCKERDDPHGLHVAHVAQCRMIDAACSLEMLSKGIPARGPFDG